MTHYPIMLNVSAGSDLLAVVVGGGRVGHRKVAGLLAAGTRVRVVDPTGGEWPDRVQVVAEPYDASHLAGARLVFACTDDRAVNARIASDARAGGAWVNVADDPAACDFTVPALHRGHGVTVAVATAGGAPAVAATLRDALAQALPEQAEEFAHAVVALRSRIKDAVADPTRRRELLARLGGAEALAAFCRGGREELDKLIGPIAPPGG